MATLLSIEGIHKTFEAGTVMKPCLKRLGSPSRRRDFISVIGEMELENQP